MLTAISPIDGRYSRQTAPLSAYFSEYALIRYRILVEVRYFNALCRLPLPQLKEVPPEKLTALLRVAEGFDVAEAEAVKHIERETNHDVKAVEYYLKSKMDGLGLERYKEFIHFGLTSQDINNTATPLLLKHAMEQVYYPTLTQLLHSLEALAEAWRGIPMLAHTHGQPASPTTVGKEFRVFTERLNAQTVLLHGVAYKAKFGGATGNFNAHHVAYPDVDWRAFADYFVEKDLGLTRSHPTTQIEHYDHLAALFHGMMRINTILIDLCRDVWTYISMEYFKQKTVAGEIGSSAMPHKVNPIDFENAEGNLGLANAIFGHLADKLPVSRLQRDLTDSTVLRNIGVPFAHTMIAFQAIAKGLGKLILNESKLGEDLDANWAVVAEAIQTILRREGYPQPYEALKELTRGKTAITQADIKGFIGHLKVSSTVKDELSKITPHNFVGLID
ncbi:MAG: adenylosuccinate lyase [Saprospiraceae bacterium]|nr:adenylosuccinate lyase [Saprospiraceae bacterium]